MDIVQKFKKNLLRCPGTRKTRSNETFFVWNGTIIVHCVDHKTELANIIGGAVSLWAMSVAGSKTVKLWAQRKYQAQAGHTQSINRVHFRPVSRSNGPRESARLGPQFAIVDGQDHRKGCLFAR
jgi:hypothetical protein